MNWKRAAVAVGGFISLAAAPAGGVDHLGWISGPWVSESKGEWTEELWSAPRGGVLLGTNKSGKGSRATGYEFMRIAADGQGAISFWASPGGQKPVQFKLVSSGSSGAVFENPANDYPTRIAYLRSGNTLVATISGPNGARAMSWTFKRRVSR
jgi:hypothetical protein